MYKQLRLKIFAHRISSWAQFSFYCPINIHSRWNRPRSFLF